MKLSDEIRLRRTDRLDEWSMDELERKAVNLENQLQFLMETTDIDGRSYDYTKEVIAQINK